MIVKKIKNYLRNVFFISPPLPTHVDIEISTACNLACKMCKRETINFGNQLMPFDRFTTIIDRLPTGIEGVSFGGYGEMLLHPKFCEMVRYTKKRGFWTQTTSNGTLLVNDQRIHNLLDSGLDEFRVSIDHIRPPAEEPEVGHVFSEKLLSILERLSRLRREKGSPIHLGINTVVHRGNVEEILDIISFAESLRLDFVALIRLDTCANNAERTLSKKEERALYKKVSKRKTDLEIAIPTHRYRGLRRLYNLRQEYCPFRLKGAHIRLNGAVTPCAFGFATHDFGNILHDELAHIWQSPPFRQIRSNDQNPVCQSCSLFKKC